MTAVQQHEVIVTMRVTLRFPLDTKRPVVVASEQMDRLFAYLRELNPDATWTFTFMGEIVRMPKAD